MLRITIPATEMWDEGRQEFIYSKEYNLQLEHSLVSLSKWESKWCKPFFSTKEMTPEETIDYVRCMTITQNVPPEVYNNINNAIVKQVTDYIQAPMTATWFSDNKQSRGGSETVTAELIYYWMIALQIDMKCEKWHLNRLLTLIKICNIKNAPPKKMSRREVTSRNAAINAARRKQFNSKG